VTLHLWPWPVRVPCSVCRKREQRRDEGIMSTNDATSAVYLTRRRSGKPAAPSRTWVLRWTLSVKTQVRDTETLICITLTRVPSGSEPGRNNPCGVKSCNGPP
jgi:hypothetical protein